jgi:hypothetical protein
MVMAFPESEDVNDTTKRWWDRRYLRLRLRGLLLIVLAFGFGFGWIAHRARVQRKAVAAIRRAGGSALYEREMSPTTPYYRRTWAPDWLVERLGIDYFEDVVSVDLRRHATDLELAHVGKLGRLKLLFLTSSLVTNNGMERLKDMRHLRYLDLSGTCISEEGLAHLKGLHRLESLYLNGNTLLGDVGLMHLRSMGRLGFLSLNETGVSDAGLIHLKELSNLKYLYLNYSKVSKDGASKLRLAMPRTVISD